MRQQPRCASDNRPRACGFKKPARDVFLSLLFASAALAARFYGDGPINVDRNGVAVNGYDVVAYFTGGRPVMGSEEFQFEYAGAVFRFASADHRDEFATQPERYTPAYGGFCTLGVSNGYKDDMDPAAFEIVGGRLYFNLAPAIHGYWHRWKSDLIDVADANWPRLHNAPGYGPNDER